MNASGFSLFRVIAIALLLDIILFDQLSKWVIMEIVLRPLTGADPVSLLSWLGSPPEKLPPLQIEILPFYSTVAVWNYGISFGLFNDGAENAAPLILAALSGLVATGFFIWMLRTQSRLAAVGLALVVGGAVGNMIDRLRFGAVFDFMDFHIASYHWPAFNVADSAIVIGIVLLIVQTVFFEKKSSDLG